MNQTPLEKSFIEKKELNPLFFTNNKLNDEVRKKLLEIATQFIDSLKLEGVSVKDIILAGSLANYNWSSYSDVDLHVLFDFSEINEDIELVAEYMLAKKSIWNLKYNIKIFDFDVELYGQDENEDFVSSGIYSIKNNSWVIEPKKENHAIPINKLIRKASFFTKIIDNIIEVKANVDKKLELIEKMEDKISRFRSTGLENGGEFSEENLVFKILRRTNYIQKLKDFKQNLIIQKLSLK